MCKAISILSIILLLLLLGLPLIGIALSGHSIEKYTEFPPIARYTAHAPFSWTAFIIISIITLIYICPVIINSIKYLKQHRTSGSTTANNTGKLPWWGIISILSVIFFWYISWGQLHVFSWIRGYTFFFLWFSFAVLINSLTYKRSGRSFITDDPAGFFILFPVSAIFWWYFEYVNGFVQNWYYIGAGYSSLEISLLSTLAFSTVLPAVSSMNGLLSTYQWIDKGFNGIWKIQNPIPKLSAFLLFAFSGSGLAFIGLYPEYLFPLVWVSPLLILVSLQIFFNEENIFSGISVGKWNDIVSASAAALICGIFWETWNFYSMPKWQYSVPLVHKFLIFEMPLLGYSGYLPFGLLCVSISKMIRLKRN